VIGSRLSRSPFNIASGLTRRNCSMKGSGRLADRRLVDPGSRRRFAGFVGTSPVAGALADQLEEGEMVAIGEAEVPDGFSFRRRVSGVMVCTVGWGMESSS
jgi:hypothetical protein